MMKKLSITAIIETATGVGLLAAPAVSCSFSVKVPRARPK